MKQKYDLEDRLISFTLQMTVSEQVVKTPMGIHLASQLARSGTSPALNYGEAQGAELKKDFLHKLRINLKELRETRICLILIMKHPLVKNAQSIEAELKECNELIGIFSQSIKTVKSRMNSK